MWWRKKISKDSFSIYDTTMATAAERLFNAWIYYYARIRCKNKFHVRGWIVFKIGWLVNNLTITHSRCNGIKFLSNKVTSIKGMPLWTFSVEISSNYWNCWIGAINVVHKNVKRSQNDWNCLRFWLGNLYKHVRKHRLFFTMISVTKHSFLDISSKLYVSDKQMISISLTFM